MGVVVVFNKTEANEWRTEEEETGEGYDAVAVVVRNVTCFR